MFIGVDLDGEEDSVNAVYTPDAIEKLKSKVVINMVKSFPQEVTTY
jgi:hypothetical protein